MPKRSSARRGSSRPASSRQWIGSQAALAATSGPVRTPFWILPPNAVKELDSPTVLYTRVAMNEYRSVGTQAGAFAFGIIIASGDPDTADLPTIYADPIDDWEADWIYRVVNPVAQGLPLASHSVSGADTVIESHAKRKIAYSEGILGVFEWDTTNTHSAVADVRILLLNG